MINRVNDWLSKNVFSSFSSLVLSLTIGLSFSVLIYLSFLQRHFFSKRYVFFAIFLFISSTIVFGWINTNFLGEKISRLTKKRKLILFSFSLLITVLLLFNTSIPPVYYLVPDSEMHISFSVPESFEEDAGVRLLWIYTGQGYVHRSTMTIDGEYEVNNYAMVFSPGQQVYIHWTGKAGPDSEIAFRPTSFNQEALISWNGKTETINLMGEGSQEIIYHASTVVPAIYTIPFISSFLIAITYLIILGTISVVNLKTIGVVIKGRLGQYNPFVISLLVAVVLVVLIFILFSALIHPGNTNNNYQFTREDGSITILSATFLLTAGLVSFVSFFFCLVKNENQKNFFFVLALGLTYLALDEVLLIHDNLGAWLDQTGFLSIIFTETSIRRWNDLLIILYGVAALPVLIYFFPTARKIPYLGEFFILAFASYSLHTGIDAIVEPPTLFSTIIEESFKLYSGLFLAFGSGVGLMYVMGQKS